jgi:hypothetical protein
MLNLSDTVAVLALPLGRRLEFDTSDIPHARALTEKFPSQFAQFSWHKLTAA